MSNNKFSDADLAGLSEEERAAISGDDEGEVVPDSGDDVATGDGEDPNFGANVPAAQADKVETPVAEGDVKPEEREFTPSFHIEGPENFKASMESLKAERAAFTAKFKEGEISVEELLEGQAAVDEKSNSLREHQFAASLTATLDEQSKAQRWKMEQEDFMDSNKQYVENKILRSALNTAVIDIASREENSKWSGKKVLAEAHKAVQEAMGTKSADPVVAAANAANAAVNRKPDLSVVPKTLAGLPAAGIQDTGIDEFAHIDKLQGVELENALAKLTPDQESRYLRANG